MTTRIDLLIVTALKDEFDALTQLGTWTEHKDAFGLPYSRRLLENQEGHLLSIAAACAGAMNEVPAATRAASLVTELKPHAIGMCGICAGKRGDTFLGDIIVAERAYSYDHGKLIAKEGPNGERIEDFFHDIITYKLPLAWKLKAESLGDKWKARREVANGRPLAVEVQRTWLLRTLVEHEQGTGPAPVSMPERATACPDWAKAIKSLEKKNFVVVENGILHTTAAGHKFALDHALRFPDWSPANNALGFHCASMATGKTVREDPDLFARLARLVRKTLGVEMEAAAIGHVGWYAEIPAIIVKAVSDHGDDDKDDSFRQFACTVSANFLLEFAGAHLGPGDGSIERELDELTKQWTEDLDDSLAGTIHLPRTETTAQLRAAIAENRTTIVTGESGAGKSVLVKRALASRSAIIANADELAALPSVELLPVLEAWRRPTVLVIDSIERVANPAGTRALTRIIRALRLNTQSPWSLILTCQTVDWQTTKARLEGINFSWGTKTLVALSPLAEEELMVVAEGFPALMRLFGRADLRAIVSQPKVLDVLCQAAAGKNLPSFDRWIGVSSFIDWYWDTYFRRDGRTERHAAAAQSLARDQGDEARFVTPLADLADASLVSDLARAGVIITRGDAVRFAHDTYADQARSRYLRSLLDGGRANELRTRLSKPHWQRAFRLLALRLLESDAADPAAGVTAWSRLRVILGGEDGGPGGLATDLLLDAVCFAAEPEKLLEALTPLFLAEDGVLLRRFLIRFLYGTTVPHPNILATLQGASREERAQAEVRFRLPDLHLWLPVLKWLNRHGEAVVALAPDEFIAIAEPWLLGLRAYEWFPLRSEVGALAISLAERADASYRWHLPVDDPQRVYLLLIASATEHRDRFKAVVRRLAGMDAPTLRSVDTDAAQALGEPEHDFVGLAARRESVGPWPGGPLTEGSDEFAKVALKNPAAEWLVEFDASFAREVFLALLIEPPHERDPRGRGLREDFEVRHPEFDFKPTHVFAPVRELLKKAPAVGVGMVSHLADLATEQWLAWMRGRGRVAPGSGDEAGIELIHRDGERNYIGAADPFCWHLPSSNGPKALIAALMTVEHWLYEKQDAKTLDLPTLEGLFQGRSVCLVGVCSELALRDPSLLLGPLEPLVTSAEVLYWLRGRRGLLGPLPLIAAPESYDFVALEHRNRDLLYIIVQIFARTRLSWPIIGTARQRWEAMLRAIPTGNFREWTQTLIAQFDTNNWSESPGPEGATIIEFTPPPLMAQRNAEAQEALRSLEMQMVPSRCRTIVDAPKEPSADQLDELYGRAVALTTIPEDIEWIVGGLDGFRCIVGATLLLRGERWFATHPERKAVCAHWVVAAALAWVSSGVLSNRVDVRDSTWDVFASEAVPLLLAADETDPLLRRAIAALVAFPHDVAVKHLFAQSWKHLSRTTFRELIHLGAQFSHERVARAPHHGIEDEDIRTSGFERAADEFAKGTIGPLPANWHASSDETERLHFDEVYLVAMFSPAIQQSSSQEDRIWAQSLVEDLAKVIVYRIRSSRSEDQGSETDRPRDVPLVPVNRWWSPLAQILSWVVDTWRALWPRVGSQNSKPEPTRKLRNRPRHREDAPPPQISDHSILAWIATFSVSEETAEKRRRYWQPWVRLPLTYHYWLETFFEEVFRAGLDRKAPFFNECLTEIFHLLITEGWLKVGSHSFRAARVALHLIGRGNLMPLAQRWNADRSDVAISLAPLWKTWLHAAYTWTNCLAGFCDLLRTPAFRDLRLMALQWVGDLDLGRVLEEHETQDPLVRFLECIASDDANALSNRRDRDAFEGLLAACVGLGNRRAIILAANMGIGGSATAVDETVRRKV